MNLISDEIKSRIYETIERSFEITPSYEELVSALSDECQRCGFAPAATKEIIVGYFFFSIERTIGELDAY